jgi:hypothetical protein
MFPVTLHSYTRTGGLSFEKQPAQLARSEPEYWSAKLGAPFMIDKARYQSNANATRARVSESNRSVASRTYLPPSFK